MNPLIRTPIRLGVNIDHVATIRNARGGARPDPVRAALAAVEAGADGITAHLREDRRHIRDEDMARLKAELGVPLNFEMAATDEMLAIALQVRPHAVCLVPERREERTTEGGLDAASGHNHLRPFIARLRDAGMRVSLFIEADPRQLEAAAALGAPVVELHTGRWCDAVSEGDHSSAATAFARLAAGVDIGASLGLEVHAGHGLDEDTAEALASVRGFAEFNIGHYLIGEAVFVGLGEAVTRMRAAMTRGQAGAPSSAYPGQTPVSEGIHGTVTSS